jgi:hypothetical protein
MRVTLLRVAEQSRGLGGSITLLSGVAGRERRGSAPFCPACNPGASGVTTNSNALRRENGVTRRDRESTQLDSLGDPRTAAWASDAVCSTERSRMCAPCSARVVGVRSKAVCLLSVHA